MTLHKLAELISLGLSVPAVILSVTVVLVWFTAAAKAVKSEYRTSTQWFALGVAVGFLGGAVDNLYWMFPWTFSFYGDPKSIDLFHFGVYSNIPFRQVATLTAAYCHIRSALALNEAVTGKQVDDGLVFVNRLFQISLLLGAIFIAVLVVTE